MSGSGVSRETLIERYFPERLTEIAAYAHFLSTAGIERGLIGPREGERIWERHIFNCLPVTQLLPQGASLFDIGSGAGLPGISELPSLNPLSVGSPSLMRLSKALISRCFAEGPKM
jgi:hypothetical protein